jgi:hypothetical protein
MPLMMTIDASYAFTNGVTYQIRLDDGAKRRRSHADDVSGLWTDAF